MRIPRLALAWALALASAVPAPVLAQRRDTTQRRPEPPLRFQFAGPAAGGRISAVVGIPGSSDTYYAGGASGGVWKTSDGGRTWLPIFDREPVQAIGALAVAPSDTNTVWAGTGEAWAIRDADVVGDGVYKSTDGGRTWKHMGLEATGRIGRIVVSPADANTVFVCALGNAYGPQQERGVYRTTDGGATWQRVLFVDENTGCSGLALDAHDPKTLFAGTWQVVMHTWGMFGGGPGSGVWRSTDGGSTWTRLKDPGLPKSPLGKIDVAVAPTDSKRVYALIQTANQGSLWRSDDGGDRWKVVSWDRTLVGRAGYYIRLAVSTKDPNEVLVTSSSLHRSTDGGLTFTEVRGGCGDCHDSWFDPTNADRYTVTGDGGLGITKDHGKSFLSVELPVAQMYHVALDERNPYWVYGNRQDDGTMRGPSDAPDLPDNVPSMRRGRFGFGGGSAFQWQHGLGGCESGFTLPDPADPDVVWASCYSNEVTRWDGRTRLARAVSPWMHTFDSPPNALKYRCHWTPPLAIDPFDHNTVYYGCQVIFRTSDGGQTWSVISPDLSTRDPSRIVPSGGIVQDNLGQFYGEVVFAIAPSKIQKGLIWAGTNDGKVWLTRDGGGAWTDVTKNVAGMPVWGTVRRIFPSAFDAGTAYMAVDAHLMGDPKPYIFKTTDFGATWSRISDGLPANHPLSYVMTVAEDPNKRGFLFAGTGHDFFYSPDDGATWTSLREGLPAAPASWVEVAKTQHDVVVSTYGRGIYILHDIAPLEQGATVVAGNKIFQPTPGLRRARSGEATLYFSLAAAPKDSVDLQVLTADGAVVRTLKAAGRAGLNRVAWDLRYDSPKQVELRTVAPDNPHIWDEPRFKGKTTRPVTHWGIQQPQRDGPLVTPGTYEVRLATGTGTGQEKQPFVVLKDSTIAASDADLAASTAAQLRVRAAIDSTAAMTNRIEVLRKQIEDLRTANAAKGEVVKALEGLDTRMLAVEHRFLSRSDMQSDDKFFVEPYGLYLNLVWLSAEIGSGGGDVAGGADHRPTEASLALLQQREQELAAAAADYQTLMQKDVPAFNARMTGKLPPIGGPAPAAATTTTSER